MSRSAQSEVVLAGLADLRGAARLTALDVPADPDRGEARGAGLPVERLDLAAGEADERVAVAERVVEERERVLAGERHQPQRHLRQVDGDGVAVDAVEAALRHQPAGERHLVLVGWDLGPPAVRVPGGDELVAELAAGLDEERAPEPIAGSQTLRSRISSGVNVPPSPRRRSSTGWSVVRTIGSVSERGV